MEQEIPNSKGTRFVAIANKLMPDLSMVSINVGMYEGGEIGIILTRSREVIVIPIQLNQWEILVREIWEGIHG